MILFLQPKSLISKLYVKLDVYNNDIPLNGPTGTEKNI